ncbi:HtrA protease/chaperone protein [hydrothermal vent metagenome]|uniref:Probable periplasmic serine endoprotease DegP-like n=1 Tax=hydrothermal vent metagenome TaxID=652676 RepID=A0A3B1DA62_9ZZZZ
MNLNFVKHSFVFLLAGALLFPVSFANVDKGSAFLSRAFALSSDAVPLSSNLFVEIAKKQNPAVVNVSSKTKTKPVKRQQFRPPPPPQRKGGPNDPFKDFYDRFFGQRPEQRPKGGTGSGFIIDPEGYILTNNHVVEGAEEITVTLEDDKEYTAELIGSDSKTDIALIKISHENGSKKPFPFLKLGDSGNLEVGEWVVAIGNPFGLSHTVTVGVVSALSRNIGAGPYDEFIQTDASINPGNSGGPLMNIKGDVIGINTAIISGNSGGNVGIGFAIPINIAKIILKDLKEKGSVTRGWLGVMIQRITPDLAQSFGLKDSKGALVGDVIPDGPAFKAGIKRGDVIVRFDKQAVDEMEALPKIVAKTTPGRAVKVEVVRDGKTKVFDITIEVLEDTKVASAAKSDPVGLQVQDITPELMKSLKLDTKSGVLVSDVSAGGAAGEAGIRRGDVITEINRTPINNVSDYNRVTSTADKGSTVLFLVRRGGTTIYVAVKID